MSLQKGKRTAFSAFLTTFLLGNFQMAAALASLKLAFFSSTPIDHDELKDTISIRLGAAILFNLLL